jgi:hypothetical protein
VVFLVLIAIAATLYNGDQEQRTKIEQNFLWQKTFSLLNGALTFLTASGHSSPVDAAVSLSNPQGTGNFWIMMKDKIKEEWDKSGTDDLKVKEVVSLDSLIESNSGSWLSWQKTDSGGEIIFREKDGTEHKLPLPFKFWSR